MKVFFKWNSLWGDLSFLYPNILWHESIIYDQLSFKNVTCPRGVMSLKSILILEGTKSWTKQTHLQSWNICAKESKMLTSHHTGTHSVHQDRRRTAPAHQFTLWCLVRQTSYVELKGQTNQSACSVSRAESSFWVQLSCFQA